MKVLSVRQPWASLIAEGYKTIELRTWNVQYRGQLAIHASKTFDKPSRLIIKELFSHIPIDSINYPLGQIIATCELSEIICLRNPVYGELENKHLCPLSHFYHVHYGWVLAGAKKLDTPIPCKGKQGLWDYDLDTSNHPEIKVLEGPGAPINKTWKIPMGV